MEKVTTAEQEMTVTTMDGRQAKVLATVTTTDHGVADENGNPKISVNINVPPITIGIEPGKVE